MQTERNILPADTFIFLHVHPSAFTELFKRRLKRFRHGNFAVLPLAADFIPGAVDRREFIDSKFFRRRYDHFEGFFRMIQKALRLTQLVCIELFVKNKPGVSQVR